MKAACDTGVIAVPSTEQKATQEGKHAPQPGETAKAHQIHLQNIMQLLAHKSSLFYP